MSVRPPHIPHAIERSALQELQEKPGLTLLNFRTAAKRTIEKIVQKGWVEQCFAARATRYYTTENGLAALRAPIPTRRANSSQ